MSRKRTIARPAVAENTARYPYNKDESLRYRKLLNKGIFDVVENRELVEKNDASLRRRLFVLATCTESEEEEAVIVRPDAGKAPALEGRHNKVYAI
jgi:hypothetical protein